MKKNILGIVGLVLIIQILFQGDLNQLNNWNTLEMAGSNIAIIFILVGGFYLVYKGLKPKPKI